MNLPVNEIFETIQGEATWTGSPAVFVRLQGCPVGCVWCDTKHTWTVDRERLISADEMLRKKADAQTFAEVSVTDLIAEVVKLESRHVVITGGEPALYDLRDLTDALLDLGRTVQLETSGTHEIRVHPDTWVTVSPKVGMPGTLFVREDALLRANEIKHPVGRPADIETLVALLHSAGASSKPVWLQPLSQSDKATSLCISEAKSKGWRVSIQTHKFLGIR